MAGCRVAALEGCRVAEWLAHGRCDAAQVAGRVEAPRVAVGWHDRSFSDHQQQQEQGEQNEQEEEQEEQEEQRKQNKKQELIRKALCVDPRSFLLSPFLAV